MRLAWRMPAYKGVMRMRLMEQKQDPPQVDGVGVLLAEAAGDVAADHTLRHALSLVPPDADVTVVPDREWVA